ncbi:MAG: hypothetical protein OQL06_00025 [Gammaproteobacteria bacterium]|nr:hypothetical protein [Gammaproteobacteria bacterium]
MAGIADFTETELWTLQTTLKERWNEDEFQLQLADAEIRLSPSDKEATDCPMVVWNHEGCNFAVFKTGLQKYRCQFFYRGYQQYGTGVFEYDDLGDCIISLLQVQADHAREQEMEKEAPPEAHARGVEKK